jgi:hypothetical protein
MLGAQVFADLLLERCVRMKLVWHGDFLSEVSKQIAVHLIVDDRLEAAPVTF